MAIKNGKLQLKLIVTQYAIVFVLILIVIFFTMANSRFLTYTNILNILRQVATIGIMSVGMTMVFITGGIDLSVGSVAGIAAVVAAKLMLANINLVLAFLIVLIISALCGLFNAFWINRIQLPPLITTLATMSSLRGVAYIITGGLPVFGFGNKIAVLGKGQIAGFPVPVFIMLMMFIAGAVLLEKTKFGRYIYGTGGNEEATRLSGINVKKIRYMVYTLCSMLSGFAGVVLLARINSGQPKIGDGYEMDVITAVVLGGVSINGGAGKIQLVIVGVLIMGILSNGMILLNVQEYVQWVVKGLALLGAVGLEKFIQSRRKSI
ncbi:MAG: ABC transporter permease [Treponema sp.]|jgi:ribose/xylose/arabinose/galactoside ABC-type transport system permease subunit|nr:ABC transporter permease [Treponema sp.]